MGRKSSSNRCDFFQVLITKDNFICIKFCIKRQSVDINLGFCYIANFCLTVIIKYVSYHHRADFCLGEDLVTPGCNLLLLGVSLPPLQPLLAGCI